MIIDTNLLSKKIYGNNSTLRQNLAGQLTFAAARIKSEEIDYEGGLFDIPSSEIVLENSIETSEIDEFRKNFDKNIEKYGEITENPKGEIKQRMLTDESFNFIENDMDYRKLFPEEAKNAIQDYYGSHFKVVGIRAYRNYHVSDSEINQDQLGALTQLWHLDSFSPSFLRLFVPLNDVTEESGPTEYISERDTSKILSKFSRKEYSLQPDNVEKEVDVKNFTVEKGSCYLLNVFQHLHRAQSQDSGHHRDIVVFNIVPDVKLEPTYDLDYENIVEYRLGRKQTKDVLTG